MTRTPSLPMAGLIYGRNVLFLGAHCDDIEIGCGGTAAKLAAAGHTIAFAVAANCGNTRNQEARNAATLLNLSEKNGRLFLGKARDGELPHDIAHVRRLLEAIRERFAPDTIFIHHSTDTHSDHKTVFDQAIRVFNRQMILLFYIPKLAAQAAPFVPNHFEDISRHIGTKLALCKCHSSQAFKPIYLHPKQIRATATTFFNSAYSGMYSHGLAEGFVVHVSRSTRDTARRASRRSSERAASPAPAISAFSSWHHPEIHEIVSSARRSIDIVDTYYDEATTLVPLVATAVRNGATELRVSVYMLDPRKSFGAHRLREKASPRVRTARSWSDCRRAFRRLFKEKCEELRDAFAENNEVRRAGIRLRLYAYPTMRALRLIAVDETHFIVGWFPLHDTNPNYCCMLLSKTTASFTEHDVIAKIEGQLREIRRESRAVGERG